MSLRRCLSGENDQRMWHTEGTDDLSDAGMDDSEAENPYPMSPVCAGMMNGNAMLCLS